MKAITICQPYAHLIMLPTSDPRHKRVENRTWETRYRGLLYVHAGKSRTWMTLEPGDDGRPWDAEYEIYEADMNFGAIIGIVELLDCLPIEAIQARRVDSKYPWLRQHQHASGPWCWVLGEPSHIGPWPWRGAQGLYEVDDEELGALANRLLGIPGGGRRLRRDTGRV